MAAVRPLMKEITQYLGMLNDKQQRVVLGVVKTIAQTATVNEDEAHSVEEFDRRFKEMEFQKVKSLSLEELENAARLAHKKKMRK